MAKYKLHTRYLSKLKLIFLITYIVIIPYAETPKWCLQKLKESPDFDRGKVVLSCTDFGIPYSGNPTVSPVLVGLLDFACLAFFIFFRWYKT